MHGRFHPFLVTLLAALLLAGCDERKQWLDDAQGHLDKAARQQLNSQHRFLLKDHDIDYRLVIDSEPGDINRRARQAFQQTGAGTRSDSGRGLLLLLDPKQDQVRLEVAVALEGVYTDAFVAYLERRQMVPFFREGRIADGIAATTELIIQRARDAKANQAFQRPAGPAFSAGAGARQEAHLGEGREAGPHGADATPTARPLATVKRYLAAMEEHNSRPDLSLYTPATRKMLQDWVMTPAQMDNLTRTYRQCGPSQVLLGPRRQGPLAVVRYPIDQRQCSPWLLERQGGQWRLALAAQQKLLGFGRNNQWHLARPLHDSPWFFGFMDWRFDNNGYPRHQLEHRWALSIASNAEGTFVRWVGRDAAADHLGLRYADRLLRWNDTPVENHEQVARLMQQSQPGAPLTLRIERDGEEITLTGTAPDTP